jgi:hypothetical protein
MTEQSTQLGDADQRTATRTAQALADDLAAQVKQQRETIERLSASRESASDLNTWDALELRESLAAYAHEAWSLYMDYFLDKCKPIDGGRLIPAGYILSLRCQIATDYANLTEDDRDSDRAEADKMIAIAEAHIDGFPIVRAQRNEIDAAQARWEVLTEQYTQEVLRRSQTEQRVSTLTAQLADLRASYAIRCERGWWRRVRRWAGL